ncbi:hypothetical protein GINT2_001295 [Glugoides intestinalis]
MLLKNFFGEELLIDTIENVEDELENKYGLPKAQQHIFEINGEFYLSLDPFGYLKGVEEKSFIDEKAMMRINNNEELLEKMFADSSVEEQKSSIFENIDKKGLNDVDQYVNSIFPLEKEKIIRNIEEYIKAFL